MAYMERILLWPWVTVRRKAYGGYLRSDSYACSHKSRGYEGIQMLEKRDYIAALRFISPTMLFMAVQV